MTRRKSLSTIRLIGPLLVAALALASGVPSVIAQDASVATVAIAPRPLDHKATLADAVPDARGVRRMVQLGGLDKITGRTSVFDAPMGAAVRFAKLTVVPHMCYPRAPEETPETSVYLDVYEDAPGRNAEGEIDADAPIEIKRIFSGWMFASSPALNALEHPVFDVWVLGCTIDDPSAPPSATDTATGELPEILPQPKPPESDEPAGPVLD